ncbi:MAG: Gfo/Idh/MocA family oxidoreductase [Kiritimatiellae bacterium]|nr:Gfo/Idh/MocA family oxidoreductase [Kiritimatiellia bacterium]
MKRNELNRREFMRLGVAAAALPGILKAGKAPANAAGAYYRANETVRVACVGYSDRFRQSLLPCFKGQMKALNFDMVAVADLWKKRLEENAVPGLEKAFEHKIAAYRSDVELYEKAKDIDAVIISTADFQHAQHATHAVNAGKDAYCEKPMAEDMYSANMLLDAVNAKRKAGFAPGAVLQIGSQRRSGPAYHAAKAYLESGKFGKLTYVDLCWNVNQNRRWRRDEKLVASLKKEDIDWNLWLLDRDPASYAFDPRKYLEFRLFWPFSSGIPGQWMCHQIDTVGWYTGLLHPLSSVSSGGTYAWNDGRMSFDTFTTILEYGPSKLNDKGFQAVFSSRQTNSARGNVEKYHGPNGTIDLCRGRWSNEGVEGKKRIEGKLTENYQAAETAANTGGDSLTSAHMYNWMKCVRDRKDPNASVDAGYGHAIALIMANAASRTGMKATFCTKTRQVIVNGKPFIGYNSLATGKCC